MLLLFLLIKDSVWDLVCDCYLSVTSKPRFGVKMFLAVCTYQRGLEVNYHEQK